VQVCREEMMIGRSDDPEHPARITGVPTPRTCLGLHRGTHLGQRHVPRKQAGHMTAHRTVIDSSPVTPCTPGPFSNRSSAVKTALLSPARVTVLSAVSTSCRNIWSGPEALALQGPQRAYA
jgi:hypothetical protein